MSTIILKPSQVTDDHEITTIRNRFNRRIKFYAGSFGPIYIYRESLGIVGAVREQSWETAYETVLDEILTPLTCKEVDSDPSEYYVCERDYHCKAPKDYEKGVCFCNLPEHSAHRLCWKCEQLDWTNSKSNFYGSEVSSRSDCQCTAPIQLDHTVYLTLVEGYQYQSNFTDSGIVPIDLNGSALDELTDELAEHLELTIRGRKS